MLRFRCSIQGHSARNVVELMVQDNFPIVHANVQKVTRIKQRWNIHRLTGGHQRSVRIIVPPRLQARRRQRKRGPGRPARSSPFRHPAAREPAGVGIRWIRPQRARQRFASPARSPSGVMNCVPCICSGLLRCGIPITVMTPPFPMVFSSHPLRRRLFAELDSTVHRSTEPSAFATSTIIEECGLISRNVRNDAANLNGRARVIVRRERMVGMSGRRHDNHGQTADNGQYGLMNVHHSLRVQMSGQETHDTPVGTAWKGTQGRQPPLGRRGSFPAANARKPVLGGPAVTQLVDRAPPVDALVSCPAESAFPGNPQPVDCARHRRIDRRHDPHRR